MTRAAVVFGSYNRLIHLKSAVESVRTAAGQLDTTMIVVDGGSTDGSREYAAAQPDIVLIGQRGPLTGAVRAFNLGFGYAVDEGFDYIAHFNDDAEMITPGMLEEAAKLLDADNSIGEVAFEFDLYSAWKFDHIHDKIYANYGLIRREAGMEVARAQGDSTGRAWWNPIYKTYGADCELGAWMWKLGWRVHGAKGLRVHDKNVQDELRIHNEAANPSRKDSVLFWQRWATIDRLQHATIERDWKDSKIHLCCGTHRLPGWINTDGQPGPAVDVVLDLARLRLIPSHVADMIYWSHGPEHVHPDLLPDVFANIKRILKPGGKFITGTTDFQGIYDNRFASSKNGSAWNAAMFGDTLSTDHPYMSHKQCFNWELLSGYFLRAGFEHVQPWKPEDYPEILAINDYATSCRLVTVHVEGVA